MTKLDRGLLLFGVAAAGAFTLNWIILGILLPGYDPISQTISELGESGSPFERVFRLVMLSEAVFLGFFSYSVLRFSASARYSVSPGVLLAGLAVCQVGVFLFEAPHPLHNVFGIASMVGFFAPLALLVAWRGQPELRTLRMISGVAAPLLALEMALNLSPLFVEFAPSDFIRSHYGAIQRSLYVTFYGWLAYLAAEIVSRTRSTLAGLAKQ
jgi:hypothetical membrane protein